MDIKHAVAQVAQQYRGEGYEVIENPGRGELPVFAKSFAVDLLARKDGEQALVRVKVNQEDLRQDSGLIPLADVVNRQPGWRLDLVVLNPEGSRPRIAPEASEPSTDKIRQSLDDAQHLSEAGELPASYLLSWAALEAAMRYAARTTGVDKTTSAPTFLLRLLYSDGLLDREEFDRLNDAMKVRNALAHGLTLPSIDPALPEFVARVARKLVSPNGSKNGS